MEEQVSFTNLLKKHLRIEFREAFREAISAPPTGNIIEAQNDRVRHVLDGLRQMVDKAVEKAASESRAPSRSASGGPSRAPPATSILDLVAGWWSGPPAAARSSPSTPIARSSPSTPIARSRAASFEGNGAAPGSNAPAAASRSSSGASANAPGSNAAASRASSGASAGSWTRGGGKHVAQEGLNHQNDTLNRNPLNLTVQTCLTRIKTCLHI